MASLKLKNFKMPAKGQAIKNKLLKAAPITKFVFFIGDEGAILVYMKEGVVQSRQFVPDASAQNLDELKATLATNTKAPLLMVLDSMDQSYIQQTLPPVSSISVNKLIKRRLNRDFGVNDIKGAIVLGREKTGRKDWNFLMVGIERTPQLITWLDFIIELPNHFQGIHLASVETEIIVRDLEQALSSSRENTGSEWKFFVSHNKVGGFRQVILRDGRIIFTRMSQPIGESSPEVIAGNIEQEMISTIEYMKRLSFDAQTGLDIYIVASDAIRAVIDKRKFNARLVDILTPFEVAQHLGIEGATQPTDQFGDVIIAASIGRHKKHVLTLFTPEVLRLEKLYQLSLYQRVAAVIIALGILGYAASIGQDIYGEYSNEAGLEQQKASKQSRLDSLHEEIKQSKLDIQKTSDMIDLYKLLLQERTSPVPFIAQLAAVLKPPVVVQSVEWSLDDKPGTPPDNKPPSFGHKMTTVLTVQLLGVNNADTYKVVSKKILGDLKTAFAGYDIAFTKVPLSFLEEGNGCNIRRRERYRG